MKKLLLGLTLLASMSSFATECLYQGKIEKIRWKPWLSRYEGTKERFTRPRRIILRRSYILKHYFIF